jgi:hypothetical protein
LLAVTAVALGWYANQQRGKAEQQRARAGSESIRGARRREAIDFAVNFLANSL